MKPDQLWLELDALSREDLGALIGHAVGLFLLKMTSPPTPASAPSPVHVIETQDRLVNVTEAARVLNMSKDWVYEHWQEWPFARKQGNRIRFSTHGLRKYVARKFPS